MYGDFGTRGGAQSSILKGRGRWIGFWQGSRRWAWRHVPRCAIIAASGAAEAQSCPATAADAGAVHHLIIWNDTAKYIFAELEVGKGSPDEWMQGICKITKSKINTATFFTDTEGTLPKNDPDQLIEATMGAKQELPQKKGDPDPLVFKLDVANDTMDVSYVNVAYITATVGPYQNDQVGYVGSPMKPANFQQTLQYGKYASPPYLFDPWVDFIHGKNYQNIQYAYAYSVDDAVGVIQVEAKGYIVDVGSAAHQENPLPAKPG